MVELFEYRLDPMDLCEVSQSLSSLLELHKEPIALAFCAEQPADVKAFEGESPSACKFWQLAETDVFFASANKHFNCPVGAMVLGFELPADVQQELNRLEHKMCDSGYLASDELNQVPTLATSYSGVVYGPLKIFPVEPQVILAWLTPEQAMIFSETLGTCRWTENDQSMILGRPACSVIPSALSQAQHQLSFGCTGMRIFTDISSNYILGAISFSGIERFLADLKITLYANKEMQDYYDEQKKKFTDTQS